MDRSQFSHLSHPIARGPCPPHRSRALKYSLSECSLMFELLPSPFVLAIRPSPRSYSLVTSRRLLIPTTTIPTTTGILPVPDTASAAKRTDQATATATACSDPMPCMASRTVTRSAWGAGCHAGGPVGEGMSRPLPSGEATRTWRACVHMRRACVKDGRVEFWRVRCK